MRQLIWPLAISAMLFGIAAAHADARSYCEDYARDVASNRMTGSAILTGKRTPVSTEQWSAANTEILADCLATFVQAPAAPEKSIKKKVVSTAAAAAPSQDNGLKPGSAAWKDYCAKKYVSFNRETGIYTAQSGKKRPCVVGKN